MRAFVVALSSMVVCVCITIMMALGSQKVETPIKAVETPVSVVETPVSVVETPVSVAEYQVCQTLVFAVVQQEKEEAEPLVDQQVIPLLTVRPGEIIRRGSRSSKMVAITIDDGWNPRLVEKALLILREEGVKSTLFPTGSVMKKNPDLWKSALADGHELGNHTYSHFAILNASKAQIQNEIQRWEQVVSSFGGEKTNFFRPPRMSGFTNPVDAAKYSAIIAEMGYITVLWSIDVYANIYKIHGTDVDPQIVVDYIVAKVRAGDIILLHFIRPDVAALRGIIRGIRAKGLEPVTLTTLLSSP